MREKVDFWDGTEGSSEQPDWLYAWFADRKIGARVVDASGAKAVRWIFNPTDGPVDAVALPLTSKGRVVNQVFYARRGEASVLEHRIPGMYGVDALATGEPLIWCVTPLDVLALLECGIAGGVSATDLSALTQNGDLVSPTCRVVLAFAGEGVDVERREETARRLGRHRCWVAQDAPLPALLEGGPERVEAVLAEATPYPIEGVFRIKKGSLALLRDMPPPGVMTTGTRSTDEILKLPQEGRLIVVAGLPNHGKTNWTRFVMVHTASRHNRRWCVFSPESQPWEQFSAECAEAYIGKPFYPMTMIPSMNAEDIAEAEAFLSDKVTMLVCDAEETAPTLDWLLERARACVIRDGTTDFLIDPWNEVGQDRKGLTETDFIGLCLQRLKAFALRHGCNVWIVVHPAKPVALRPGETRLPPGPYDLAGSAHWANRADLGLTISAPELGKAQLMVWKSRSRRWGTRGTAASMEFDKICGRYSSPVVANSAATGDLLDGEWGVNAS